MAFSFSPKIVTDGLVLALDAANARSYPGSGNIWSDLSVNFITGSLINGPTFNPVNGGSIQFDGTNDYFITQQNFINQLNITSQISLECWIKCPVLGNQLHGDGIISKGLSSDGNSAVYELLIRPISSINYPFFRIYPQVGSPVFYWPTNIAININEIYHIVCTFNGTVMNIFINGISSGNGQLHSFGIQSNTQPLTLGVRYKSLSSGEDSFFNGNIFISKVYNRALSPTEVLQNYNATKSRFNLR